MQRGSTVLTNHDDFSTLIAKKREFFATRRTFSYDYRIEQLKKLRIAVNQHKDDIVNALGKDLKKPEAETLLAEILLFNQEIKKVMRQLKSWMKPVKVPSVLPACFPGQSFIMKEPYGVVLIIAPWNYPFLLTLIPLIGAIAAGNCVILKPSEYAPHMAELLHKMVSAIFSPDYISVLQGDALVVTTLLLQRFDYIFFTGSTKVAKTIMRAAADYLTPVTLELGGKSPCIVDRTANIPFAVRRILWSKFLNAGQTCIAPDYVFVEAAIKEKFIKECISYLKKFYGDDASQHVDYTHIINEKHFDRLVNLTHQGRFLTSFKHDKNTLYMSPLLLTDVKLDDPIMQEEIFGPLLPIHEFNSLDEPIQYIAKHEKPLSLYFFTQDKKNETRIIKELSFGGGCINDCMMQMANPYLPFGGVGQSGMGNYHGYYTFNTFSHPKSIFKRLFSFDLWLQYPPYTAAKLTWIKRLVAFFS